MAKDKERQIAQDYFVNQGLSAKQIAEKGLATEKTIGNWIKKGNWKKLRDAKMNSTSNRLDRINEVTDQLAEQRLQLFKEIEEAKEKGDQKLAMDLQRQAVQIDDSISKWNKRAENVDKENRISLSVYLEVMEDIFNHLQMHNSELFLKTIDFQEEHINTISNRL
ncbi:DUF1804 family protein [Faecalibacter macacae]|uniref:DUF1804 family protein n=1 Tax=Faecalibacter macacae TaxID=1859289 RepID=A0A3L9M718_9FLAO|nr:DUF1804 family protein [Faecalibacter macacae]RLZ08591.1 DUF1804 family protein [Faecalibacter macacae]